MMLQLHWAQNAVGPAEVSGDVLPEPYRKALGRKLASKRRPCIKQSCSTTMSLWTHGKSIAMIKSHRINMTRTSFREFKAFQCAQNFVSPAAFNVCQRDVCSNIWPRWKWMSVVNHRSFEQLCLLELCLHGLHGLDLPFRGFQTTWPLGPVQDM